MKKISFLRLFFTNLVPSSELDLSSISGASSVLHRMIKRSRSPNQNERYMKYNHFLMLLTTGALAPVVTAQDQHPNLVQNGGFETLAEPVTTWDQLDRATGWSNANLGSVDVYGKGAASNTVGIPQNDQGSTEAFEGASYAGFVAWKDEQHPTWPKALNEPMWWNKHDMTDWNPYTEYLQIALGSPSRLGRSTW